MQFKTIAVLASLAAAAVAAPQDVVLKRDDDVSAENVTLSTFFTTETFTASQKFQSMMKVAPWVTTITTETVWTVAHTVTRPVPTSEATSSA